MSATTLVRISDRRPLLRAGLDRIARRADVVVVESGPADLVLRSLDGADMSAPDGPEAVEIIVTGDGTCVITCRYPPEPEVWQAVLRVITAATAR